MLNRIKLYTPRSGSPAKRVIDLLAASPEKEFTSGDLAILLGTQRKSISSLLWRAIDAGLITMRLVHTTGYYRIARVPPQAPQSNSAEFSVALDSTGKIHISGATVFGGVTTLSADQASQMHDYLAHTAGLITHLKNTRGK